MSFGNCSNFEKLPDKLTFFLLDAALVVMSLSSASGSSDELSNRLWFLMFEDSATAAGNGNDSLLDFFLLPADTTCW